MVKCQMPTFPTAMSSDSADCLKNDFQTAIRRNLHTWARWRTKLNDNLVDAVMTGNELGGVESFRQYLEGDAPDPDHPTSNPRTLLTFSAAPNSATNLHSREFVKYGIPRAKLDPRLESARRSRTSFTDDDFSSTFDEESDGHFDASKALYDAGVGHEDHESDDLKMDYFYQNESEAAALTASATSTLEPRRFHRSAATLPVAPVVEDSEDRRSRFSRKAEQRRQNTMPPSYLEPFVRPGHGFITARCDKELYTRSAGYLDRL